MATTSALPTATAALGGGATPARVALVVTTTIAIAAVALALPAWPAGEDMGPTHYMGRLAANQPWNLLLFMAIPVIATETIAVTGMAILFNRRPGRVVLGPNKWAGLLVGLYFVGITVCLLKQAVLPLTATARWRGPADLLTVGFYLLGVVPLYGMTLLETRVLGADWDDQRRLKTHATFVGIFLVVAHIAMIAGMLDPSVLGWDPSHAMDDGPRMSGLTH